MKPVLAAVLALVLTAPPAAAADVVVYRCTAADGAVTLQNGKRCPTGQREERRVLEVPASRATPAAAPAPASATSSTRSATATPASPAGRGAPTAPRRAPNPPNRASAAPDTTPVIEMAPASAPPVFACRTWDGQRYYGDSERPAPRCAPLETVGLDRRSATAAQACELRSDACEPVVESARCDAWAERLRVAEARERFGTGDEVEAARTELGRLRTIVAGTVCAR